MTPPGNRGTAGPLPRQDSAGGRDAATDDWSDGSPVTAWTRLPRDTRAYRSSRWVLAFVVLGARDVGFVAPAAVVENVRRGDPPPGDPPAGRADRWITHPLHVAAWPVAAFLHNG